MRANARFLAPHPRKAHCAFKPVPESKHLRGKGSCRNSFALVIHKPMRNLPRAHGGLCRGVSLGRSAGDDGGLPLSSRPESPPSLRQYADTRRNGAPVPRSRQLRSARPRTNSLSARPARQACQLQCRRVLAHAHGPRRLPIPPQKAFRPAALPEASRSRRGSSPARGTRPCAGPSGVCATTRYSPIFRRRSPRLRGGAPETRCPN